MTTFRLIPLLNKSPCYGIKWKDIDSTLWNEERESKLQGHISSHKDRNFGLLTGKRSGVFGFDIDSGKSGGIESFQKLCEENEEKMDSHLRENCVIKTPSGGYHIYYKYKDSYEKITSFNGKLGKGLDVKNNGGYLVYIGSKYTPVMCGDKSHKCGMSNKDCLFAGKKYELLYGDINNLKEMPQWLEDKMLKLVTPIKNTVINESLYESGTDESTDSESDDNFDPREVTQMLEIFELLPIGVWDDYHTCTNLIWTIREISGILKCAHKYCKLSSKYTKDWVDGVWDKYDRKKSQGINSLKKIMIDNLIPDEYNKYWSSQAKIEKLLHKKSKAITNKLEKERIDREKREEKEQKKLRDEEEKRLAKLKKEEEKRLSKIAKEEDKRLEKIKRDEEKARAKADKKNAPILKKIEQQTIIKRFSNKMLDRNNRVFFNDIEKLISDDVEEEGTSIRYIKETIAYIQNGGSSFWITKGEQDGAIVFNSIAERDLKTTAEKIIAFKEEDSSGIITFHNLWDIILAVRPEISYNNLVCLPFDHLGSYGPNIISPKDFNTFTGFMVKYDPKFIVDESKIKALLTIIRVTLSDNNEERIEYNTNWFAHILQKPYKKTGVALIFQGSQGTGKSTIMDFFGRYVIGKDYYLELSDSTMLTRNFNKQLVGKILICKDESEFGGGDQSKLKNIITSNTITIEPKGQDPYVAVNIINVTETRNRQQGYIVIKMEGDERRNVAQETSNKLRKNEKENINVEFWDDYYTTINDTKLRDEMVQHFYHYLIQRDLSKFKLANRPKTELEAELKEQNAIDSIKFLTSCLETYYNNDDKTNLNSYHKKTKTPILPDFKFINETINNMKNNPYTDKEGNEHTGKYDKETYEKYDSITQSGFMPICKFDMYYKPVTIYQYYKFWKKTNGVTDKFNPVLGSSEFKKQLVDNLGFKIKRHGSAKYMKLNSETISSAIKKYMNIDKLACEMDELITFEDSDISENEEDAFSE